jgi:hypothetical protein
MPQTNPYFEIGKLRLAENKKKKSEALSGPAKACCASGQSPLAPNLFCGASEGMAT